MKSKEINKAGDWSSIWTDQLKNDLKNNSSNHNVGEHLILETKEFKVWSIYLEAGKALPFHKHDKPYFYTAKSEGKSRSFHNNGSVVETEYKKDDIKFFDDLSEDNYFIHNLENIGNTTLIFTTVEFK